MNIIKFDEKIYINYPGLRSLKYIEGLEQIFLDLLKENQIINKGAGHIFINEKVHILEERKKLVKLGLIPSSNYFKHFWKRRFYLFDLPNTDLHFTGFFRIQDLSKLAADYKKEGYRLTASDSSYVNGNKLNDKCDFQVMERHVDTDHEYIAYFLKQIIPFSTSESSEQIDRLYFPLSVIFNRKTDRSFDIHETLSQIDCDAIFAEGKLIKKTASTDTADRESPMKIASRERIIAALFWVLKNPNRPKFKTKAQIYRHIERYLTDIDAVNERYISEFIAAATSDLEKRELDQGFDKTYLDRVKL